MRIKTEEEFEFEQERKASDAERLNNREKILKDRGEMMARHYLRGYRLGDIIKIVEYAIMERMGEIHEISITATPVDTTQRHDDRLDVTPEQDAALNDWLNIKP